MITSLGGKKVFSVGIGTWRMGGAIARSTSKDKEEVRALEFAINQGINVIDTAEIYGHGHAEELVGQAISGFNRGTLFIISKVFPTNLKRGRVLRSAEESLKRLRTDYMDLYLIHWQNPLIEIRETIGALEELADSGIVKNIGVSNFGVKALKAAINACERHKIAANEIPYSIMEKDAEKELIPFCQGNNVKVIAHTPLARGRVLKMSEVKQLALKYKKKPVQVALNYLMRKSLPIPKASSIAHLREFKGAVGWHMDENDYKMLSEL